MTMREITTHQVADLPADAYAELKVFAGDADQFGVPHAYDLKDELDDLVAGLNFQSGDPRKGWNGGTSLAYLAVVLDFLESCERSKFACEENRYAIAHIKGAITALQERIRRRHREGTFQSHQASAAEGPKS